MYSNWAGLETGANIVEVVLRVWEFATCGSDKSKDDEETGACKFATYCYEMGSNGIPRLTWKKGYSVASGRG